MGSILNLDRRSIAAAGHLTAGPSPGHQRYHHPDFDSKGLQGWRAVHREATLPQTAWKAEREWAIRMGLAGADSIEDRGISTFARGELPHYAGINTFLKTPYVENVRDVGKYDAAILGVPFDGGTTFRPGTRFGPQGIRRISALYTPYNFEIGVDLREQMTMCDLGDVFTIPANLEKTFDQISRAVAHVFSQGALPVILGGDHSIGFPTMRGIAQCTSRRIGIIHFDRHADIQEKDLDERMHTTPWFHATNLPNVPASNLVQIGIGGWQVPRDAIAVARQRDTTIITMSDVERLGIDKVAEIALEIAWKDADAVYMSFDIDSVDCGFVPGTGWPEPGGFLPREALGLVGRVAKEGLCGMEIVEVSPPYDTSDITALFATRVIVDALGALVANGKLGAHKPVIDKPATF
jgi:agmatinase